MVGVTAAELSFEKSSTLLRELADLTRSFPSRWNAMPRPWEARSRAMNRGHHRSRNRREAPDALHLGLGRHRDPGAQVGNRRPCRQDSLIGSARTREVKLATIWSAESRDTEKPAGLAMTSRPSSPLSRPGSPTLPHNRPQPAIRTHREAGDLDRFAEPVLREYGASPGVEQVFADQANHTGPTR